MQHEAEQRLLLLLLQLGHMQAGHELGEQPCIPKVLAEAISSAVLFTCATNMAQG